MKLPFLKLTLVFALVIQLAGCGRDSLVYKLDLPEPPQAWVSLLGEPHWRIEWFNPNGQRQVKDILPRTTTYIEIPSTWTNPVTAWPWWPGHNLISGLFKPAGALFPYDAAGNCLRLTWKAGVDTVFFTELAYANSEKTTKIPSNFDWVRFRELFNPEILSEAVCNDPWLVDWRYVAEKTISGNFDRRRLVPQATEAITIPLSVRVWYGTSPFSEPLFFAEDEPLVFQEHTGINTWISGEGILRCDGKVWFFSPLQ